MRFKQRFFYYSEHFLLSISFLLSIPVLLTILLLIKIISRKKQLENLLDRWGSYFSTWNELLWLYKKTSFRYKPIEITYPIFEDKRSAEIKSKDHFITLDVELIEKGTIIYFEPFACTAVKFVIRKHLSKLRAYAGTKNLSFFFWPVVGVLPDKSLFRRLTKRSLSLYRSNSNHESDFFRNPVWISDLLHDWLDTKKPDGPCLLYNTGLKDQNTGKVVYEVFCLPCKGKRAIKNAVYYFIFKSPDNGDNIYFQMAEKNGIAPIHFLFIEHY